MKLGAERSLVQGYMRQRRLYRNAMKSEWTGECFAPMPAEASLVHAKDLVAPLCKEESRYSTYRFHMLARDDEGDGEE